MIIIFVQIYLKNGLSSFIKQAAALSPNFMTFPNMAEDVLSKKKVYFNFFPA